MNASTPYRTEKHSAASLRIHPLAQRDPSSGLVKAHLRKMEQNFDLDAIGMLYAVDTVINGEQTIWVIDGWHRLEVLSRLGFGEWEVEVWVYETDDPQRAHQLFLEHNDRALVNSFDKFRNEFGAGDMTAVGVSAIVQRAGYKIGPATSPGVIACPNSLKKVFDFDYGRSLRKTLNIKTAAWGNNEAGHEGRMIEGLGRVFARNNGAVEESALATKLSKYPGGPAMMIGAARARKNAGQAASVSKAVTQIITEEYNKGRRTHRIEA